MRQSHRMKRSHLCNAISKVICRLNKMDEKAKNRKPENQKRPISSDYDIFRDPKTF